MLIEIDIPRYGLDSATIKRVADSVPEANVVGIRTRDIPRRIAEADAFVGNLTPAQVRAAARLRWLQVPSGGVEDYGFAEIRQSRGCLESQRPAGRQVASTARSRSRSAAGESGAWVRICSMRSSALMVSPTPW